MFELAKRGFLPLLFLFAGLAQPASAQVPTDIPPAFRNFDANGVDLTTGDFTFSLVAGTIGSGESALSLINYFESGMTDNLRMEFLRQESGGAATISLIFGNRTETFTGTTTATSLTPELGNGATLVKLADDPGAPGRHRYLYTDAAGAETLYEWPGGFIHDAVNGIFCGAENDFSCTLLPKTTTFPTGRVITWSHRADQECTLIGGEEYECIEYFRQSAVATNSGYKITFSYVTDIVPPGEQPPDGWHMKDGATFTNTEVTGGFGVTYSYPSSTVTDVTAMGGRTWRVTRNAQGRTSRIRRPGSSADDIVVSYGTNGVTQVVNDGVTTGYARVVSGTIGTMTVTDADGGARVVVSDLAKGRPTSDKNPLNRTTSYQYDANARLTRITAPEGNYVAYTYDARGNVTQTKAVAKVGSGLSDIITTAGFPSTCTDIVTCNQPTTTTDARGKVTAYEYDPNHGGVTEVTPPAPATGEARPQTRYSYTTSGGVSLLTGVSACRLGGSGCVGGGNEVKTTIAYGANRLPTSVTTGSGLSGGLTATTATTYDAIGNVVTVDGPLPGTADTTRYHYNSARERIGIVSPDPDGAGPLTPRAQRLTYNSVGQATKVEVGNVTDQSDPAWEAMTVAETADIVYDANSRKVKETLVAGGATHAVVQYSYDTLGRLDCTAQRMNPLQFGSLPASACTPDAAGAFGPDRIAKTFYDAASQVTKVQSGLGVVDMVRDDATTTYTPNGKVKTLADAKGNTTTYDYDGFDRPQRTWFPGSTISGPCSAEDCEELTYDEASRVTSRQLRDGKVIAYGYDDLDRLTLKDLPDSEVGTTYAWDWFNRPTAVVQGAFSVQFAYDALSRAISTTTTLAGGIDLTTQSDYDLAGRRTKITHHDDFVATYTYLVTGEVASVRQGVFGEAGSVLLATFDYDQSGRRTALNRTNGMNTTYAWDAVSRLSSLTQNLLGTADDLTLTLGQYNPAGQIGTTTRSNNSYNFDDHVAGTTPSAANVLNQLTTVGGATLTYDGRGNFTDDGPNTYAYSSENLLTSATIGAQAVTLQYDPLLRLRLTSGPATRRFLWDGADMIAEYNGPGTLLKRYVFAPGIDEPLVEYIGAGTADRRWLHADERGSIVAVSDTTGAAVVKNTYDEYGNPGAANSGRFQYTGQMWIPELGLHYYKARFYNPKLGRFMQTDPIGYGAGMNLYTYVGADPVNFRDPLGLQEDPDLGDVPERGDPPIIVTGDICRVDPFGCATRFIPDRLTWIDIDLGIGRWNNEPGQREVPQKDQTPAPCAIQIANSITDLGKFGVTGKPLGLPPYGLQGKTVTSTFYGSVSQMGDYFGFLGGKAGDLAAMPNPFAPGIRSVPSGITFRYSPSANDFRIDVPMGALGSPSDGFLNRPESLHRNGNQCPATSSPS